LYSSLHNQLSYKPVSFPLSCNYFYTKIMNQMMHRSHSHFLPFFLADFLFEFFPALLDALFLTIFLALGAALGLDVFAFGLAVLPAFADFPLEALGFLAALAPLATLAALAGLAGEAEAGAATTGAGAGAETTGAGAALVTTFLVFLTAFLAAGFVVLD
jgi:hypothetical protein